MPHTDEHTTLDPRPLTRAEAVCLHEELKTTPNIIGYTVGELVGFRNVLVAEVEGTFAGACISKDLALGWTDIAALYVLPAFRRRGIGAMLYTAAFTNARERGRHIFTLSRSPAVIHLMGHLGMETTPAIWKAPLAVHLHMNRHMMSRYRWGEMRRKTDLRKDAPRMIAGMLRRGKDFKA